MKKFFMGTVLLLSLNSLANSVIIFEQSTTTKLTIINDGQQERFGNLDIIRAPRPYYPSLKGRIRIGDRVITSDKREGVVKSMFPSSDNVVVFDEYYGNRTLMLSQIAVTSACATRSLCVDDEVITSDKRSGVIAGYFGDGTIAVKDKYFGYRIFEQRQLAVTEGCTNYFCIGDRVITSANRSGVVSGFFGDGTVAINDSYFGYGIFRQKDLSITDGVCSDIYIERVNFCD